MQAVHFVYRFVFSDGRKLEHKVSLDAATGRIVDVPVRPTEKWTVLDYKKCSHCPLKSKEHPHCPVAKNLSAVAHDFKSEKSHEQVTVEVISDERTYSKTLALQDGLFGLFGLIMATSDCPHISFLRPMARFHLPFSSLEETTVRAVSFYLLRQTFVAKNGGVGDFSLAEFARLYENLSVVNLGIVDRIRSIALADADLNSVVGLDAFAMILSKNIKSQLDGFESLFK